LIELPITTVEIIINFFHFCPHLFINYQPTHDRLETTLTDLTHEVQLQRDYKTKELESQQALKHKIDEGVKRTEV
jgi:hypothetical protein